MKIPAGKEKVVFIISKSAKEELGCIATQENKSMSGLIRTIVDNYITLNKHPDQLRTYNNLIYDLKYKDGEK